MSTLSERLEAEIWLETASPDLSAAQRDAFFAAVDAYYCEHPTADRDPDALAALREDDLAFSGILREILGEPGRGRRSSETRVAARHR